MGVRLIQQPFLKLQILNFHETFSQSKSVFWPNKQKNCSNFFRRFEFQNFLNWLLDPVGNILVMWELKPQNSSYSVLYWPWGGKCPSIFLKTTLCWKNMVTTDVDILFFLSLWKNAICNCSLKLFVDFCLSCWS